MEEWIKTLAAEMVPQEDPSMYEKNTQICLTLTGENVDIQKLYKLLTSNGFPVIDIKQEMKEQNLPINEGDMVQTSRDIVANKNTVTMKTPTALYSIPEAVLPQGYLGQVVAKTKDTITVKFDANIPVTAYDQSGYIEKVAYYVDTLELSRKDLKKV